MALDVSSSLECCISPFVCKVGLKVGQSWAKDARFVKYFCSGELMKGEENFLLYRDG